MRIEKLEWKTFTPLPGEFRCMICNSRDAAYIAHPIVKKLTVNLPVCEECSKLSDAEAWEKITGGINGKQSGNNIGGH